MYLTGMRATGIALMAVMFSSACASHATNREPIKSARLTLVSRAEKLDTLVREPMLVKHQSGALFIAGYNRSRPRLWKSLDEGTTWTRVDAGSQRDGAVGNSDVDLAVAPDGTLYFVNLTYDGVAGEGRGIAIGVSHDIGASWHWTTLSQNRFDDRPWVDVAPDGTVHVVWSDDHGVSHALSRDAGATWIRTGRIHDHGGSSHMAIGPLGEIAVRVSPGAAGGNKCDAGTDLIAVSTDGGSTWDKRPSPAFQRPGCEWGPGNILRWVDPIAWTPDGKLNALWTDSTGLHLSVSPDRGQTWKSWTLVPRKTDEPLSYYPYLASGSDGSLGATWFSGFGDEFHWHAGVIRANASGTPQIQQSPPFTLESERGEPPHPDPGGEYIPVAITGSHTLAVVTPIQHQATGRLGFTFWRFSYK